MQSALASTSFGMPSGMPRISLITVAAWLMRSFSFFCPATGSTQTNMRTTSNTLFFINPPFERFSRDGSIHGSKDKTRLLLFRLWGSHILREAFQRNLARVGRSLLRFVACVLDQSSLQHVIRFVASTLALAPLDRPSKFERYTVHDLGGKRELITIELTLLEKVVQKSAAIALRVAVARNKARNASLVFDGDLHELTVAQKAVHARVIRPGRGWTRGPVLPLQFRLRALKHQSHNKETRKS